MAGFGSYVLDALVGGSLTPDALQSLIEYIDHREHVRLSRVDIEAELAALVAAGKATQTNEGWQLVKETKANTSKKTAAPKGAKPKSAKAPSAKQLQNATFEAAAEAARGDVDAALPKLIELARQGSGAAAGAVAEIEGFLGHWASAAEHARQLLAKPESVHYSNVFEDCAAITRRAARELGDPQLITLAAAVMPQTPRFLALAKATLLSDSYATLEAERVPRLDPLESALALAPSLPRLKGKPASALARHCFSLAVVFHVDDEIIARWDASADWVGFDQAIAVACAFMRRGQTDKAWAAVKSCPYKPVEKSQVAPVILLAHPVLIPLMTPERCSSFIRRRV